MITEIQISVTGANKLDLITQLCQIFDFPFAEQLITKTEIYYLSHTEAICHVWGWQEKIRQYAPSPLGLMPLEPVPDVREMSEVSRWEEC